MIVIFFSKFKRFLLQNLMALPSCCFLLYGRSVISKSLINTVGTFTDFDFPSEKSAGYYLTDIFSTTNSPIFFISSSGPRKSQLFDFFNRFLKTFALS